MLKTIELIFILLIGISLIIIASLFTGIEIDNILYKNININKLYLKYDKNLNISAEKITITNETTSKKIELETSFTIKYTNGLFSVNMKKFSIYDEDLEFTGNIYIYPKNIDLNNNSNLMIKNLELTFDKKLDPIKAHTVFANYQDNKIDLSFQKPYYKDVLLEGSEVSFGIEDNTLRLYLKTKSLFNNTLRDILSYYDVEINTIQYDGKNDISADIHIPFNNNDIEVEADVTIMDSNLEDFGYKYKVKKSVLTYKNNIIKGKVNLDSIKHNDMEIFNSVFDYAIDIKKDLKIAVNTDTFNFNKAGFNLQGHNALLEYKNNKINYSSIITDENNQTKIKLHNFTDLHTKETNGSLTLNYENQDQNVSLETNKIEYQGNYINDLNINIQAKDIQINKPYKSKIKTLSSNLIKDKITSQLSLNNEENTQSINILNTTDIAEKISYGNINIEKFIYKDFIDVKNKNVPYKVSFKDSIIFNSPIFGLTYYQSVDKKETKLIISNPKKLLDVFEFITVDKNSNGFIDIESNDNNETVINIDSLNINLNNQYFESEESIRKNITLPKFPKLDLVYTNSDIKYDHFTLSFDTLNMKTDKSITNTTIKKENSLIKISTEGNRLIFNASNLSDNYINNFLNEELLEEGYVDLNIYGDDINYLSGDINLYDTTIKNVTLINSLSTFVNTTPAIINPLLALPTLFRLAETGFNTNGYYLEHGDGTFRYDLPKNELDIYDLYTNGKMSNFIVNSHTNLTTKKIIANVNISFLKDFTTTLNYIPIVGYIIMGDDGEFHTSVDITGTTDNPQLETHTVKEASNGLTGILKRILTLPLQPFKIKVTEEQKKAHNERVKKMLE